MRHRASRHLCLGCHSQRARFRYRGRVRADRDHTLCFRCYRSACDRLRARRLLEVIWELQPRLTLASGGGNNPPFLQIPRALSSSNPSSALAFRRQKYA